MKIRADVGLLVLLLVASVMLAGCGNKPAATADKTTLKIGWDFEMAMSDPAKSGYFLVRNGMLETLVDVDEKGNLQPGLALEWKQIDPLTWQFKLRPQVKFHDGSMLTADVVRQCLERFAETAKTLPLRTVEILNDQEFLIRTKTPMVALPSYLATPESAIYGEKSLENGKFVRLIGTGPYKMVELAADKSLVTEAFADYWQGKPPIQKIIDRYYPDAQTRFMALQSGEIDFARNIPFANAKMLQKDPKFVVMVNPVSRVRVLYLNTERPGLSDPKVREAIDYALDRKAIIESVLEGFGEMPTGMFPKTVPWGNPAVKTSEYSVAKAKELLDAAGWVDKGGIREKDGHKLEFTLLTYTQRAELPNIAQVLQAQLAAIGIKLNVQVGDTGMLEKAMVGKDFDLTLVARGLAFTPDPSIAFEDFRSGSKSKYRPNYVNPQLDHLLEEAMTATDSAVRKADYDQAQVIIAQERPALFLNYYVQVDAFKKGLQNYYTHPTELHLVTNKLRWE